MEITYIVPYFDRQKHLANFFIDRLATKCHY